MSDVANPEMAKLGKRRVPRLRFSLRTLVILVLLLGSAGGLWWHWEPWARTLVVSDQEKVKLVSVALSLDGNLLAVGMGPKNTFRNLFDQVEDLSTNQRLFSKSVPRMFNLQFSRGGKWLYLSAPPYSTAPRNARMVMSSTTGETTTGETIAPGEDVILDLWPDDSKALLLHGDEGQGRVVEVPSGRPIGNLAEPGRFFTYCMCWDISHDGRRLANFSDRADGPGLVLYAATDLRVIASMPELKGYGRFTEDSKLFLFRLSSETTTFLLFDAEDGHPLARYEGLDGFTDSPDIVALKRPIADPVTDSSTATIQTIRDGKVLGTIENAPLNLWFSDDMTRIVGNSGRRFAIWNISGGAPIVDLSFKDIEMVMQGSRILSWSKLEGNQLAIWDVHSGRQLCSLRGHEKGIEEARLAQNEARAMSWDESRACVWSRRRPEYWWGIAWLPEFWLTLFFAGAFVWSILCDRKRIA